jgi:hypothetical protein
MFDHIWRQVVAGDSSKPIARLFMFEHDLFRKPVSTPGSSPGAGFFGIML